MNGDPAPDPSPTNASGPPPLPCSKEPIKFDPEGDLRLIVGSGSDAQEMLVDSRALCRSTPVFRKMLAGTFAEAKPASGDWVVKLPEDNPNGFVILMDMVHHLYERTPNKPSLQELYDLTVLTDKYDMTRILRSKARLWFNCIAMARMAHFKTPFSMAKRLCICWEAGYKEQFSHLVKNVAKQVGVNEEGLLLLQQNTGVFDYSNIMDAIKNHRDAVIDIIQTECGQLGQKLLSRQEPDGAERRKCRHPDGHAACLSDALVVVFREAHARDIHALFVPQNPRSQLKMSIIELLKKLKEIQQAFETSGKCRPMGRVMVSIERRMAHLPCPLTDFQKKHLQVQAAKTGLSGSIPP